MAYVRTKHSLGDLGQPDIGSLLTCPAGAPPTPRFVAKPSSGDARALHNELENTVGAACRGRIDAARKILKGARFFQSRLTSSERGRWDGEIAKAEAYIAQAQQGASGRLATQEARESQFTQQVRASKESTSTDVDSDTKNAIISQVSDLHGRYKKVEPKTAKQLALKIIEQINQTGGWTCKWYELGCESSSGLATKLNSIIAWADSQPQQNVVSSGPVTATPTLPAASVAPVSLAIPQSAPQQSNLPMILLAIGGVGGVIALALALKK